MCFVVVFRNNNKAARLLLYTPYDYKKLKEKRKCYFKAEFMFRVPENTTFDIGIYRMHSLQSQCAFYFYVYVAVKTRELLEAYSGDISIFECSGQQRRSRERENRRRRQEHIQFYGLLTSAYGRFIIFRARSIFGRLPS